VSFDAHADCKDSYLDEKIIELDFGYKFTERFNDSTWFRRSWEEGIKGVLVGIRALDEDEFEFIEKEKIPYFSSEQIKKQIKKVEKNIRKFTKKKDILISLDIDVFDPSIAPAVHYPEPNGILFEHFESIVKSIKGRIVGIDLTCVNSFEGKNYVTEFLAIRSLFSIFSKLTF
ncbi:MAG: arginase family protein, partial [Candidatus Aenigmarchaeota archaeon]|nr:arginase family protein [Candidatus Aenigmarchaeota archaeon]